MPAPASTALLRRAVVAALAARRAAAAGRRLAPSSPPPPLPSRALPRLATPYAALSTSSTTWSPRPSLATTRLGRADVATSAVGTAVRAASGGDASASSTSDGSDFVRDPPPKSPADIVKRIGRGDVTIAFARSGGAGGQNVNKVNTKVDMRLDLAAAAAAGWLAPDLAAELARTEKKRINKDGALVVTSTKTRSQADNVDDALAKMQAILDGAATALIPVEVDPEKAKQVEKQKRAANENRLVAKKAKSDKKKERRAKIEW